MEKIHGNTHVFVLTRYMKAQKRVYFLHLELTFTPHYIITDKGLLQGFSIIPYYVCMTQWHSITEEFTLDMNLSNGDPNMWN